MTSKGIPPDPEFAELVRRDVFGESTDDERAHLRSDGMLERWVVELRRVANSVGDQLKLHADQRRPRTEEWRQSASYLWVRYNATIEESRVLLNELRERHRGGDIPALKGEMERLRAAIRAHQAATVDADAEPEAWDLELWAQIEAKAKK